MSTEEKPKYERCQWVFKYKDRKVTRVSRLYADASVIEIIEDMLHQRPDYGGSDGEGVLTINADDDFDTRIEID